MRSCQCNRILVFLAPFFSPPFPFALFPFAIFPFVFFFTGPFFITPEGVPFCVEKRKRMGLAFLFLAMLSIHLCLGNHPTGDLNDDCLHCRDCYEKGACDTSGCSWCRRRDCPCRGCDRVEDAISLVCTNNCVCNCGEGTPSPSPSPSPLPRFSCAEGSRIIDGGISEGCTQRFRFDGTIKGYFISADFGFSDPVVRVEFVFNSTKIILSESDECEFADSGGDPCKTDTGIEIMPNGIFELTTTPRPGLANLCRWIFCA